MELRDGFIVGIFNYCDRWCERCPLTSRCRLFSDERKLRERAEEPSEEDNMAFWELLEDATDVALESIEEEPFEIDSELVARDERLDEMTDRAPLVRLSHEYAMVVHQWLDEHQEDMPSEENRFRAQRDAITPPEALEVISWHGFQIAAKLSRATRGRFEAVEEEADAEGEEFWDADDDSWDTGSEWDDDEDEGDFDLAAVYQDDADGSAKVALIGIERSIGAWTILRGAYSNEDAQILTFLRQLFRLRHLLEAGFPAARAFRRPGFDE